MAVERIEMLLNFLNVPRDSEITSIQLFLAAIALNVIYDIVRVALCGTTNNLFKQLRSSITGQVTGLIFMAIICFYDRNFMYTLLFTSVITWVLGCAFMILYLGLETKFLFEISLTFFGFSEYVEFIVILAWLESLPGNLTQLAVVIIVIYRFYIYRKYTHSAKPVSLIPFTNQSSK